MRAPYQRRLLDKSRGESGFRICPNGSARILGAPFTILKIPESPGRAARDRLTLAERTLFDQLTSDRRRSEWWAGRIAGQEVLARLGFKGLSILSDERGAPRLVGAGADRVHIALSHGRRIAGAIATQLDTPLPCVGIDIVDREDLARMERISRRVLTERERELAHAHPDFPMVAWGAREALAKATLTGMFAFALSQVSLTAIDWGHGSAQTNLGDTSVAFERLPDGGVLVIAGTTMEVATCAARVAGIARSPADIRLMPGGF